MKERYGSMEELNKRWYTNFWGHTAKAGTLLPLDGGISAAFLAPVGDKYEDPNQYSAGLKIQYGQMRFLFMGDAGLVSE